jgi:hypothetical protein
MTGGTGSGPSSPGTARLEARGADNPYSRLAVDVLKTVRRHELALSPSVVAYLKMLVTLGTLRHQLASNYDLQRHVQRFFERMLRQQGAAWLDPRTLLSQVYDGSYRLRRALAFVEFLEAQEPLIAAAEGALFGVQRRIKAVGRRVMTLAFSALVVGGLLYFVLADPDGTRAVLPTQVPYTLVHVALLVVLALLIASLVLHGRQLGRQE